METNPTQTKKYKLLLITDARGNEKHVPLNKTNKDFYTAYKSTLSKTSARSTKSRKLK